MGENGEIIKSESIALELVGMIYDAASDPSLWDAFLVRLASEIGGSSTTLFFYNPKHPLGGLMSSARTDPAIQQRYNEYYIGIDAFGVHGGHLLQPGTVKPGQALCPDSVLVRTEFYNDFLRPVDLHHQVCGVIARDGGSMSILASLRAKRFNPFDESEQQLVALLLPHLRRAFTLHRQLSRLTSDHRWQADQLDALPIGIVLIGMRGSVLHLNAQAHTILSRHDGLGYGKDGLHASLSHESRRLQALINQAVHTGVGRGISAGGVLNISRPCGRRAYQLLVSPYRCTPVLAAADAPAATVFIFDPDAAPPDLPERLIRLYGLTAAESQLAALLATGSSVASAADQLQVTRHTLRTHLKSIFAKTGVHRQTELLHQIYSGPAMLKSEL